MDDIDDGMLDCLFLKIFCVFYVIKFSVKFFFQVSFVMFKLFFFIRIGERFFELMFQMMFCIEVWLKVIGVLKFLLILCMIFYYEFQVIFQFLFYIVKRQFFLKIYILKCYNLYVFIDKGILVYNVEIVRFFYREFLKLGVDDKRINYISFSGIGKYYVIVIRQV